MSAITLLVVGDLHLGRRGWGLTERIRDHARVLPQINDYVELHQPDAVCLLGDVFNDPNPDSFSFDAFREFLHVMPKGVKVMALTGNHDRERLDLGVTRVQSAGSHGALWPQNTLMLPADNARGFVEIRGFDWRPAARIAGDLETLPDDLDVLLLHQSCEGMLPAIAEPEVRLEQLRDKARLILVGDVHVNRELIAHPSDTLVVSCGSTERCALDEDPRKVVKLIEYDVPTRRVASIVDLPLRTRPIERRELLTPDGVQTTINRMNAWLTEEVPGDGVIPPLIIADHLPSLADELPRLEAAARESTCLLVTRPLPALTPAGDSFVASRESATREMEDIITTRHPDDAERAAALALWRNPENSELILTNLE